MKRRASARGSPIHHGAGPLRFSIRANDPGARKSLAHYFGSFGPPPSRPAGTLRYDVSLEGISRDGVFLGRIDNPTDAAGQIVRDLEEQVPARSNGHVCLHAGAVSARGRGLLLPAVGRGGKSTLTLGLVRRGFTYYTDDLALIDLGGARLSPFPRPIDLREDGMDFFPRIGKGLATIPVLVWGNVRRVSVRVDRRRTGRARARVRWIVFPRIRTGRPTVLGPIPRREAVLRLSKLAFNLDRLGRRGFDGIVSLVQEAECYSLDVGALPQALRALSRLLR